MNDRQTVNKMRVSFDLDEVLFVSPETHKTEPPPPPLLRRCFKERLRLGTPELIRTLQERGCEVWVYTSSFRSERYIRWLFLLYGVRFNGIVNGDRHLREVQRNNRTILPQKLPSRYRISLHIDDENIVCALGRQYGYRTYQLTDQDDDWKEKIIARAAEIRKLDYPEDEISRQPEETGKQPEKTGKQPEETGKQPEETGKQPEETGKQPEETGKQPEVSDE